MIENTPNLAELRANHEAHSATPRGASFHRAAGPKRWVLVLNGDRRIEFFGSFAEYQTSHQAVCWPMSL